MVSEIKVASLVTGKMVFNKDSNVVIKNVDIFLKGVDNKIAEIKPVIEEFGASFSYIIGSAARAGQYEVVWNKFVSGKEAKEFNTFVINDDAIDRTLPLELQHLK